MCYNISIKCGGDILKVNDKIILNLFEDGCTVSEISKNTGLSRQGIYNILKRNSVNYKKASPTISPELLKSKLKKNSIRNVVRETGIPYHRVRKTMQKYKIEKNEIMRDILKVSDVERLYNELGFSDEKIAEIFNCSQYTIRSFRWKNNIYDKNRKWQERLPKSIYFSLRQKGYSLSDISEETDVPYYTVVKAKKLYEKE